MPHTEPVYLTLAEAVRFGILGPGVKPAIADLRLVADLAGVPRSIRTDLGGNHEATYDAVHLREGWRRLRDQLPARQDEAA